LAQRSLFIDRRCAIFVPGDLLSRNSPRGCTLRQFGQQRSRVLDVGVAGSLGKPTINRRKEAAGLGPSPLKGGAESWAILASIVNTAKLHELDPQAYLTDVLERIVSGRTKSHQLHELLAWNWKVARQRIAQAAA
jgi:hypothetical protein